MRTLMTWIVRIVVIVVSIKLAMWAWDRYQGSESKAESEVLDIDKVCRILSPDTGRCLCRHRVSNEILDLTHDECTARAKQR